MCGDGVLLHIIYQFKSVLCCSWVYASYLPHTSPTECHLQTGARVAVIIYLSQNIEPYLPCTLRRRRRTLAGNINKYE